MGAIIVIAIIIIFLIYNQNLATSALKSDRIFVKFEDSIHNDSEQQIRMQRALQEDLRFKKITENKYGGTIIGSSGKTYSVSLRHCTCPDYHKRQKPCKHMYRFVLDSGRANIIQAGDKYTIQKQESDTQKAETKNNTSPKPEQHINFNDNMNYMLFDGEGVYEKTKRKRNIHIEAFSEQEAIDELIASGYIQNTITLHRVPFDSPSEAQLSAMKKHHNKIPKKACMNDISFLISKYMHDERESDKELMSFATDKKVKLSYYAGEKSLYRCIWNKFSIEEKFAFYLLCVEKDRKGKWDFGKFDSYKTLASDYVNDKKFMNSFKQYLRNEDEFLGFIKEPGIEYGYSASRNTNCYKIAREIISD